MLKWIESNPAKVLEDLPDSGLDEAELARKLRIALDPVNKARPKDCVRHDDVVQLASAFIATIIETGNLKSMLLTYSSY